MHTCHGVKAFNGLADQGCLLRGSAAGEIDCERKRMQAKMILMGYDVNLFRSVTLGTTATLVTGGNKGIGFCIVKFLCQQFDGDVFLTGE
ncbi:hypothetical protein HPB52_025135 [Rhipicephalus sanguineus]|uniref:Uncharacterized protein n=1 Tax=Rhipicephalus sanguineus TaxID=34632 RepID=A0A9D4TEE0_RHISA|nr:hypothetical protein HPB52_025135 [Rhipicephalus sanguineus]